MKFYHKFGGLIYFDYIADHKEKLKEAIEKTKKELKPNEIILNTNFEKLGLV